ncbi:hypothetical protein EJB05_19415 [Eragrostis curvula]|uniref:Nucleolar protein 58/56 N-terminal domain-containing protein n=1 Tax=Eragrostis curvula TaxID=38414 RepID=A0A5J9UVY3_9POAL|nr:hypothetical protein EJB05_19415 [Eragrostis curvula]
MVRSAKKETEKHGDGSPASPPSFPPPPPPGSSDSDISEWLGHYGIILVLFETPSGFALLRYDGVNLFRSGGLEAVTLLDFQIFKDKNLAINPETGLSDQLVQMITAWHSSGQKLAVGKSDYKTIIQEKMGIHCLFNEPVMELMWGLKNMMKSLVQDEKCDLSREDRCHMSQGMLSVLNSYGFNKVEPEMVDENLIMLALTLFESDYCVNKFAEYLHFCGKYLKELSGINPGNWDLQKLATALKLICYPQEEIETGNSYEMLSEDMAHTLVNDAHKYERILKKSSCLNIYKEIIFARWTRSRAIALLKTATAEGACATQ